jgi:hypothetical protein
MLSYSFSEQWARGDIGRRRWSSVQEVSVSKLAEIKALCNLCGEYLWPIVAEVLHCAVGHVPCHHCLHYHPILGSKIKKTAL